MDELSVLKTRQPAKFVKKAIIIHQIHGFIRNIRYSRIDSRFPVPCGSEMGGWVGGKKMSLKLFEKRGEKYELNSLFLLD